MAKQQDPQAVPSQRRFFRVAPSPLNDVKLDLGILLVVGALILLVVARISGDVLTQLLMLLAYGLLGMIWVVVRVRRAVDAIERSGMRRGSEQE